MQALLEIQAFGCMIASFGSGFMIKKKKKTGFHIGLCYCDKTLLCPRHGLQILQFVTVTVVCFLYDNTMGIVGGFTV